MRKELQRVKLRGRRALGFERRLEKRRGSELARRCWKIKERGRKRIGLSKWEEERKRYFVKKGVNWEKWKGEEIDLDDLMRREIRNCRERRDGIE